MRRLLSPFLVTTVETSNSTSFAFNEFPLSRQHLRVERGVVYVLGTFIVCKVHYNDQEDVADFVSRAT
jgi:hypothetical protein